MFPQTVFGKMTKPPLSRALEDRVLTKPSAWVKWTRKSWSFWSSSNFLTWARSRAIAWVRSLPFTSSKWRL